MKSATYQIVSLLRAHNFRLKMLLKPSYGTKRHASRSPSFLQRFSTASSSEGIICGEKHHSIIKTDSLTLMFKHNL
jgi:hypothetical protein